jgi:dTDP-4-dehydrorhamnose reductase
MTSALIGSTGFVGTSLLRQRPFDHHFHSRNIERLAERRYELVVCAGAPAQKWIANQDPVADRERLASLQEAILQVECSHFVLISTVDVFARAVEVDESSLPDAENPNAYGVHRLELERLVANRFAHSLIVRLPGLVGPGLRKNALFDLQHSNSVNSIDSRARFQFYPMVQLWTDIATALEHDLRLIHLTAEPMSVADVAGHAFGITFNNVRPGVPAEYDFRSQYAALFGGMGHYQYSRRESLLAIRAYRQSEPQNATGSGK